MVRLKEIAAAAGVSAMTVSKALRDKPDLAPATKERIRKLAAEMGYVPDLSAQQLRGGTTRLLGLVISASTNPVNARIMMALEERAHERGYDLILAHSLNRTDREEAVLRRLLSRRVDGLFIAPVYRLEPTAPIYDDIFRRGIPTVILGQRAPFCARYPAIETADADASESATRHLLELGHRRIAFFAGPMVAPWAQQRLDGYRRAHREAGLPLDDKLIFNAGSTHEEGASAALQFMQESPGATALQCVNDLVAIGAADTLLNQGVRIPMDLSVVGFGNVLTSEFFRVPLTTVRQPKLRLGVVAMETMMKLLRGEPASSHRLPAELVIRASTSAPQSKDSLGARFYKSEF
jgi:LacI family transcriptional regulator